MPQATSLVPRYWWAFALRAVAAIVFGVLALIWPAITLATLIVLFGTFAFVNGVMAIISAFHKGGDHVWLIALDGGLSIAAAIAVFSWPGLTALLLVLVLAVWAIVTGVVEMIAAIRLRDTGQHTWLWVISGVLSVIFGGILIAQPGQGALAVIWVIGVYAILYGASLFAVAWRIAAIEHAGKSHPGGAGLGQPVAP